MGANGNINDLELAKFIELAWEFGLRVHILHGDNWLPSVANLAALPASWNTLWDIRQLLDTGTPYRWDGVSWEVWSTSGVSWGGIAGTLSDQTDLQAALDAKMGWGAYVLVSRDSLITNQINLGNLTSGILKQSVSAGIATISILTDNSGNWNTAYSHSQDTTTNPHSVTKTQIGLGNADDTSDVNKPVSTAQQTALDLKQNTSEKDATDGYAGLTLFKINFKNIANTFTSFFTNSNTEARTYNFQNRDGTIADDTDLALKAPINSPTFTGTVTVPTPSNGTDAVTKSYADALVAGLLDYRGWYDASINLFPSTGWSWIAGAVLKGDMWIISVSGTLGGTAVQIWDSVISNIDTPGQTSANWNILDSNISYTPEDIANKATTMTGNTASNTIYLSAKAIYDWVTTLLLASLTGKTTPVNADWVPIMDSAASNVMKFLTFTNLKAFLKTYFDTIYAQVSWSLSQVFSVLSLELGHASDTSFTRVGPWVAAIEWNTILTTAAGTSVETAALKSATTTVNVSSATAPTTGQVLTATSGTAATWQTPTWGGIGTTWFSVKLTSAQSITSWIATIQFNNEEFDDWWNFNTGTYRYTAPSTWKYYMWYSIFIDSLLVSWDLVSLIMYKNDTTAMIFDYTRAWWGEMSIVWWRFFSLTSWDTIEIKIFNATAARWHINASLSWFYWYKLP